MAQLTRDPLEHFAYELLRAANLDAMPEDAKAMFVMKIRDQAERRIGIIAVEHLDDAALAEFQVMMAAEVPPAPDAVQAFFTAKIPSFEQKMHDGLMALADEFIAAATV